MTDHDVEGVLSPPEIMASLLEGMPSLMESVQALVQPIRAQREAIRLHLESLGMIQPLTDYDPIYNVGATDGAYVVSPMIIGDHIAALSVAVTGTDSGGVGVVDHRSWSDFRSHTPDAEVLAKAVMMGNELCLLPSLDDQTVKIIDGSYATPLIAVNMALASADPTVRRAMLDLADQGLVEAVEHVASTSMVVACPKADSSTAIWDQCAPVVGLSGGSLTDKALASLVLEPGEALYTTRTNPSWEFLYASQGRVTDAASKALADRLALAVRPLTTQQVHAYLAKPHDATTVIRIETHPGLDDLEADEIVRAVCCDTSQPFVQEPLSQYVADIFAKSVSQGADVQMETLRLDLAMRDDTADFLEYLIRYYRTNI